MCNHEFLRKQVCLFEGSFPEAHSPSSSQQTAKLTKKKKKKKYEGLQRADVAEHLPNFPIETRESWGRCLTASLRSHVQLFNPPLWFECIDTEKARQIARLAIIIRE